MGLACAPDVYQEAMHNIFCDMTEVIVYMDDLAIITTGSFEHHLEVVAEVLRHLRIMNLQVNGLKSHFLQLATEFLGFVLTRDGIKPQHKKVQAILNVAPPKNVKQVRSFLGMINHYKALIHRRSHYLAPLVKLTAKGVKFQWTDVKQKAFDNLKQSLACEVCLAYPDFT
jgi:hypothetical protein